MISTVIRTAILYFVVTIAIRLMGKRQIGDMQPNELVITLLISEIAAIPLQDSNQPVLNGVSAISVLVVLEILISVCSLKFSVFRRFMNGKAVILIKDGVIDQKAMKNVRVTANDLIEMLRSKDVFNINEVAFAMLEVNGELSVLLKSSYQTVTPNDMNLTPKAATLPLPVIIDGEYVKDNLNIYGIKESDIKRETKKKKTAPENVFLMTADGENTFDIIKKEK